MATFAGHHITLLGDSILDNKAYTRQERCVTEHLRSKLQSCSCTVTNCAEDGAVMDDVCLQLGRIPDSSTVLVLSAGGNDALKQLQSLESEPRIGNLCSKIGWIRQEFRSRYAEMLHSILQKDLPLVACTVYYPRFQSRKGLGGYSWWEALVLQIISCIGVFFINLVIKAECRRQGLPIIDLARVFNHAQDYANPIEPSVFGGDKISNNIIHVLNSHPLDKRVSATFGSCAYSATHFPDASFACPRGENDTMASGGESRLQMAAQNEKFRGSQQQASTGETGAVKRNGLSATASKPEVVVARYESVDAETGRVWGMPNAGGRGQCLDCPKKAALPSKRCVECQLAYAKVGEAMPAKDQERLQSVLDELVQAVPEAKRGDILTRLQFLKAYLSGEVQQPVQLTLLGIADAVSAGDRVAAQRQVAWLAANHWDHHKAWIVALRCLLA